MGQVRQRRKDEVEMRIYVHKDRPIIGTSSSVRSFLY